MLTTAKRKKMQTPSSYLHHLTMLFFLTPSEHPSASRTQRCVKQIIANKNNFILTNKV